MENLIIYMAKACGLIAVFYLSYHALLKKETFFGPNRWFLLAGLFTAVALPLVVYTKTIWIEPSLPVAGMQDQTIDLSQMIRHHQMAKHPQTETISINWFDVTGGMYLAGVLFFFIRFVLDFLSIRRILSGNIVIRDGRFRLIDSEKARSPFSFFNYIVYNSAQLQRDELASIIEHEKVHSSQKHSLDMIFSQLFCIVFWFNPFVWMYKKSISQNLEFIADAAAIKIMEDRQAYQKTLLKITVQPDCIGLTNHFYQSLIKKRIVMLNKERSKQMNYWKYATVLPLLAAFILLFQVKVVAQEKDSFKVRSANVKAAVEINKDTKDSELEESKKNMKEEFDADVVFQNVTRNLKSEITAIKVTVKDKGQSQVYEVSGNDPISPFTIEVEKNDTGRNIITFGTKGNGYVATAHTFQITDDGDIDMNDSIRVQKHRIIAGSFGKNDNTAPTMEPNAPGMGHWPAQRLKIGDTNMLIVINGVKQEKKNSDVIKLPIGQEMAEMNILDGKAAKKKYGKEAKKGAVEITTKSTNTIAFNIGPEHFDFNGIREGSQIQGFSNLEEFENILKSFPNPDALPFTLSPDMQIIIDGEMEKIFDSQELNMDAFKEQFYGREMPEEELEQARTELEKAKKEIEESRKEVEKARTELEKARKGLNKKA
jgi:BlaR1 peptidase M56